MDKPIMLVVEDNEIQRKVIKLLASEFGFEVVLCGSCSEAMDAYAVGGDIYSLILMDLRLPDIDGSTCTRNIRDIDNRTNKRIPVVAMTGYMGMDDKAKCGDMGFDDCLIKPFSSKEFRDMVLKWTHSKLLHWPNHRSQENQGNS